MTAQPEPSAAPAAPGVALAQAEEREDALIGKLPAALQQHIRLRKLANLANAQIAKLQWGKNLDKQSARAIAEYARAYQIDPVQEIDLMGGAIYLNAKFYIRKLAEKIEAGLVDYAGADHVEDDPRLEQLGEEGKKERERRLRERVHHAIPDKAKSAVVFRVKLKSMTEELAAANWAGGGVKAKVVSGGKVVVSEQNDPIGEAEPEKSAETRAARRCIRFLASHMPALAQEIEVAQAAAEELRPMLEEAHERNKRLEAGLQLHELPVHEIPGVGRIRAGSGGATALAPEGEYAETGAKTAKVIGGPWAGSERPVIEGIVVEALPSWGGEYRLSGEPPTWYWHGPAPVAGDAAEPEPAT